MPPLNPKAIAWSLILLITVISLTILSSYFYCVTQRITYPFELQWMEGGSVDHIAQVLVGKDLYSAPSLDFVPFTYTPLFFYLAAGTSLVTGSGFLAPRIVSVTASLLSLIIFWFIFSPRLKRSIDSTASPRLDAYSISALFPGLVASALFAGSYPLSDAHFDIARIDSLFIAFLMASTLQLSWRDPREKLLFSGIVAGLLLTGAFLTKQVATVAAFPVIVFLLIRSPRLTLCIAATAGVAIGSYSLYANLATGGWYWFYVFSSPQARWWDHLSVHHFLGFWLVDIIPMYWPLLLAVLISPRGSFTQNREGVTLWLALGFILAGWFGRSESLNYLNSLMPAHAGLALLGGLLLRSLPLARPRVQLILLLLTLLQLGLMLFDPRELIPGEYEKRSAENLIKKLQQVEGEVWIPSHGHLSTLAGKQRYAHIIGMMDLIYGDREGQRALSLRHAVTEAFRQQKFAVIIDDFEVFPRLFGESVNRYYTCQVSSENFGLGVAKKFVPIRICVPRTASIVE